MSIAPATVYTGSVNPSRRAKASRTLLPRQTSTPAEPAVRNAASEQTAVNALPARRGRKPGSSSSSGSGGLSRTARETQRKLNHSIIEKARRTKINEALAELARLGEEAGDRDPSDTADPTRSDEEENDQVDDGDDDDVKDGDYGVPSAASNRTRANPKSRPTSDSTNSSKGKDKFKLDILVKTVESMQFLLEKVRKLETELRDVKTAGCHRCLDRELADQVKASETEATARETKRKRHAEPEADERAQRKRQFVLPSISSWLPNSHSSPDTSTSLSGVSPFGSLSMLSPRTASFDTQSRLASYLPSPPSSTQFTPSAIASSGAMPVLELGPSSVPVAANRTAISSSSVSPSADSPSAFEAFRRPESGSSTSSTSSRNASGLKPLTTLTPEDESAASLLLHISSSPPLFTTARGRKDSMLERVEPMAMPMPTLMPVTAPSPENSHCNSLISKNPNPSDPSNWREDTGESLSSTMIVDSTHPSSGVVIAQTPSSILGLG